jgi:hypothetical protein
MQRDPAVIADLSTPVTKHIELSSNPGHSHEGTTASKTGHTIIDTSPSDSLHSGQSDFMVHSYHGEIAFDDSDAELNGGDDDEQDDSDDDYDHEEGNGDDDDEENEFYHGSSSAEDTERKGSHARLGDRQVRPSSSGAGSADSRRPSPYTMRAPRFSMVSSTVSAAEEDIEQFLTANYDVIMQLTK